MDNTTLAALASPLRGLCPAPFYDVAKFGMDGCRSHLLSKEATTDFRSCYWTVLRACRPDQKRSGLLFAMPVDGLLVP